MMLSTLSSFKLASFKVLKSNLRCYPSAAKAAFSGGPSGTPASQSSPSVAGQAAQPAARATSSGSGGGGSASAGPQQDAAADAVASAAGAAHARWRSQWSSFLNLLYVNGHYAADQDNVEPGQLDANKGAMKRAVLSFARQRPDLRYSLPLADLVALVQAGFPRPDRKSVNAYKRLEASILHGRDLSPAEGGPADFQDVARMLYALAVVDARTAEIESPGLAAAACSIMPNIIIAAQEQPASPQEGGTSTRGMRRPVYHSQQQAVQKQRWHTGGAAEGRPRSRRRPPPAVGGGGAAGNSRQQGGQAGDGSNAVGEGKQQQRQQGMSWWDAPEQPSS